MGLFLPQRWRRQPQVSVGINRASPLSSGINHLYWFGTGGSRDLVRSTAAGVNTAVVEATTYGLGKTSNGSTTETSFPHDDNLAAGDLTFFVLCRVNSIPANFSALFDKPGGGSRELALFYDTAGKVDFAAVGMGNLSVTSTLALPIGTLSSVCLIRNMSNNNLDYFVNGVKNATLSTAASGVTAGNGLPLSFGLNPSAGGSAIGVTYYAAAHWPRVLADAEVVELYANPWQLVGPIPSRDYFFSAAAAGDVLMAQACL